jgi:hypothetical protein
MRAAADKYRAKAFECLSLAECMPDPERRQHVAAKSSSQRLNIAFLNFGWS